MNTTLQRRPDMPVARGMYTVAAPRPATLNPGRKVVKDLVVTSEAGTPITDVAPLATFGDLADLELRGVAGADLRPLAGVRLRGLTIDRFEGIEPETLGMRIAAPDPDVRCEQLQAYLRLPLDPVGEVPIVYELLDPAPGSSDADARAWTIDEDEEEDERSTYGMLDPENAGTGIASGSRADLARALEILGLPDGADA